MKAAVVIAEVEWLAGTDTAESIARRVGYRSTESLARVLRKHGRHDLALAVAPKVMR